MTDAVPPVARIAVILAGGRATRMNGAKATAELAGETLLERAIAVAKAAALEPVVCARHDTALPPCEVAVWREPASGDGPHPLAGIALALERAAAPIVALPVDLPLLTPGILTALAVHPAPLAAVGEPSGDGLRPAALVLRADPSLAPAMRQAARDGAPSLRTLTALGAELQTPGALDPLAGEHALTNVNDEPALRRAAALLGER